MRRLPMYVSIDEGVYPVCADTLLLLEAVEVGPGQRFLEMGCGAGLVGMHAAALGAEVTMVDVSPEAVACARRNVEACGLEAAVVESDLFLNVDGVFDVVAFNPPYLPGSTAEGDMRLDGGEGGVEIASRFLEAAEGHIAEDGKIYILLSSLSQRGLLDDGRWLWHPAASTKMFFEELTVYLLTRSPHSPTPPPHTYMLRNVGAGHGK